MNDERFLVGVNRNLPGEPLTARQREVHALLRRGLRNKQIARELGIAERTVKVHLGCIFVRLGVTSRLQAALKEAA